MTIKHEIIRELNVISYLKTSLLIKSQLQKSWDFFCISNLTSNISQKKNILHFDFHNSHATNMKFPVKIL
jgi:hypothetical protein